MDIQRGGSVIKTIDTTYIFHISKCNGIIEEFLIGCTHTKNKTDQLQV